MPQDIKIYTVRLDSIGSVADHNEIGVLASYLHKISGFKVDIPSGFVITTSAFEDFLTANDMVSEIHAWLKTLNSSNIRDIEKAEENIKELYRAAVVPSSIFEKIREAYEEMARFDDTMIELEVSWISDLVKYSGGIEKKYAASGIYGIAELEKAVINAWQSPFDSKAIFERMQNGYNGNISIALVIKKQLAAEVSGKLYSYNPLTNNQNEQEIQAFLGLWAGVDELEQLPDHYIVNKQNEAIEEKNVMTQSKMLLKKGFSKGEDKYMKVDISKQWQVRQKISDKIIQDLSVIGKTLEAEFAQNIELDWILEAGKIYITNIRFNPKFRHSNSLSFNPNIVLKSDYKIKSEPLKVEIIKPQVMDESQLEEYVDEIEQEIADLDSVGWSDRVQVQKFAQLEAKKSVRKIEEHINSKISSRQEPKEKELFENLNYQFLFKEKFETVTKIYLDITDAKVIRNVNSDAFDGVYGLRGEEIIKGFDGHLKGNEQQFVEYGVSQILKLVNKDKQKDYIYSISNLSGIQAAKYSGINSSGLNMHIENPYVFELELEILRQVRNKKNFRRLWMSMKGFNQVADYKYFKKIIEEHALKRSPSFRFFMEIDLIPPFLNIMDYIDDNLDGVIIDLDLILKQILGTKVSIASILNNKLFWSMMDNISSQTENRKIPLVLKSKLLAESDELLTTLLKYGVLGVTIVPDKLLETRNQLHKLELKRLG